MRYPKNNQRPALIEMIRAEARNPDDVKLRSKIDQEMLKMEFNDGLLDIKPANTWMTLERDKPKPKMLFGNFWVEGELCILFADTNMGKSILAVQLGDSISRQQNINGFELEAVPGPVLYVDFELSSKQFETRYSDACGGYKFADNFFRAEVNLQAQVPEGYNSFTDYMSYTLHRAIKSTDARVLIIDNITCLGGSTEQSGRALAMMKQLKLLKTRHELSILVLAHTPKRKPGKTIGRNDLGGSKMLINFADSAMAMADSCLLPGHRYLKQVKQRNGDEKYGENNVCLFKLERKGAFVGFNLIDNVSEHQHLHTPEQQARERQIKLVASLQSRGFSQRQIAARLRLSIGMVNKLAQEGAVVFD